MRHSFYQATLYNDTVILPSLWHRVGRSSLHSPVVPAGLAVLARLRRHDAHLRVHAPRAGRRTVEVLYDQRLQNGQSQLEGVIGSASQIIQVSLYFMLSLKYHNHRSHYLRTMCMRGALTRTSGRRRGRKSKRCRHSGCGWGPGSEIDQCVNDVQ